MLLVFDSIRMKYDAKYNQREILRKLVYVRTCFLWYDTFVIRYYLSGTSIIYPYLVPVPGTSTLDQYQVYQVPV